MTLSLRAPYIIPFAAALTMCLGPLVVAQSAPGPVRTILQRHDITAPGYEAVLVKVEIPVGGREGRHTHAALATGYIEQGTLTLEYEGRPTTVYKPGDSFILEPGKVHEGINTGNVPVKAIATFIVKKGVPLTTPAAPGK